MLHSFGGLSYGANAGGAYPYGGLALGNDGNFYGTTERGGTYGSDHCQNDPRWFFSTIYTFSTTVYGDIGNGNYQNTNSDGANPYAALTLGSDDDLYGTTEAGGINGNGASIQDNHWWRVHALLLIQPDGAERKNGCPSQ